MSPSAPHRSGSLALTSPWPGPHGGVPPWDKVVAADFPQAFTVALAEERAEIATIAGRAEPPTFENTIAALQRAGRTKERVQRLFNVMRLGMSTPEYQALDREWQPRLSVADDEITFYPGLFERIDQVYQSRAGAGLRADQARLVTLTWETFVRAGARLASAERTTLSAINQELAELYADFRSKVMADEDTWTLLNEASDLAGLPSSLVAAAESEARARGIERGWIILNTRSSVDPFLTCSPRRDLRQAVWTRFKTRGDNGDERDTNATIVRIVALRAERAALLGYPSHAHLQMADSMAKTPERARELLEAVWQATARRIREEVADMQVIAERDAPGMRIEPWDYLYYAERVREQKFDFDQAVLRPYFEIERMVQAVIWSSESRYGLRFTEITGSVPAFHPDVRVWEIVDAAAGTHCGLLYFDTFARAGKRSGAWASSYRVQHHMDEGATAITSVNNNFLKGADGAPSFVSLDDARTLFHEFGHALHSLMQDVTYPTLAETPRDFVELPSQINEQWLFTRELLDRYARHVETGESIPQALLEKVKAGETFNQGYKTGEAVSAALVDLELHTRADGRFEPRSFEREALQAIGMPRELALRHRLPHFDHLFGSDSYSGLYYSYLWADVMSADGWRAFLEAGGPWDTALAKRFRECILADGNTVDRAEAYRRFRGRDPDVSALLEERGLAS
ncbi:MAG: M3 family metallopeptidase [Vicinamibacterales bacterium]